ncbi:helix-turn-helix domain-containing protein [Actinomadura bangladeshensis]|uniref:Helix-turn-helix transcriptional regulator n=1 Tax=Actinomadura bangladeshensis TaxID=453573 RepID=A0A6L9QEQ3_9ACTN|nr:helix-turn-helix transcriptional regulator [Actinomadura bangladeshensis]NEA22654.1 helix-turn-helix transcriptional regulator [Actinomadura bangladeshensis]
MTATDLVAALAQARLTQRLGRPRLAAQLKCARNTIHRWETRRCSPSLDAVVAWAAALGYRVVLVAADQTDDEVAP